MAVSLSKGQAISLAKFGSKYELRAGWDKAITGRDMDLDIMALLCDSNEKALPTDTCLIFYNFLILLSVHKMIQTFFLQNQPQGSFGHLFCLRFHGEEE